MRVSLAQARTGIYDGTELLAWSLVPRVQQMAGDLRYGAPCTPELQDHLGLLLDLVAAVLGGSDEYGGPERAYYDHTQCGLAPPEERYLARRLWVLEAYPWELLLAPVLVLPAFIAYTSKLLQPYLSSEKYAPPHTHTHTHARHAQLISGGDRSDKIFVSINDDLMKDHRKADRKKYFYSTQLPARY